MNNFNNSGIVISIIIIMLIAGIAVINYTGLEVPYLVWIEKGVYNIITPPVAYFTNLYNSVHSYWDRFMNVGDIMAENKRLERKISSLKWENLTLKRFERENQRLRELLAFKKYVDYQTKGARVIGYNPSNWGNTIIINRGKNDGLKDKMPVISYNGLLVGRVDFVGANSAQVKLVNNPEFVVGGIVQRQDSRAIGLVRGQHNERGINIMDKISWDADIKKGDFILTSGLSNNYPKGLPIGEVVEVKADNYGLSQKAKIELFFSLRTIEEVLVITDY